MAMGLGTEGTPHLGPRAGRWGRSVRIWCGSACLSYFDHEAAHSAPAAASARITGRWALPLHPAGEVEEADRLRSTLAVHGERSTEASSPPIEYSNKGCNVKMRSSETKSPEI